MHCNATLGPNIVSIFKTWNPRNAARGEVYIRASGEGGQGRGDVLMIPVHDKLIQFQE